MPWLVPASLVAALGCGDQKPPSSAEHEGTKTIVPGELRKAAQAAGKLLGAAVDAAPLRAEPRYAELLASEFDSVTPENATKWGPLAPTSTSYQWEDADAIVDFAAAHSQLVKGHTFVWHRQYPSWLNGSMSAEELRAAIKSHIETTLARYRGKVRAWDVVNEAVDIESASGYTESLFFQKLGPSYIEDAFRWARAADPDVLLYYNEVGIERLGPKSDFTYALMRDLLAKGVPIDGIGFQSHISIHRYPAESNLRANIRRFAELGLRVNISELDARTMLLPGSTESRWEAQRVAFQQVVGACILEPGCESVTLWGFTDKYSWINDEGPDDPLLFDRNYEKKPAYFGVLDGLGGRLPTLGENRIDNGAFDEGPRAWMAASGELSVAKADGRDGQAACVSARTTERDALAQPGLEARLATSGPLAFSSRVRLRNGSAATVQAALKIQEAGGTPTELSLGSIAASDTDWVELAGYFGLGFEAPPTAITLELYGPAAGIDLCVADVAIRPLSANPAP
ncbi:MAG TPA: endo-1,4-beta-xylanase [Polyangiaceae bacterium]|nr:endo-1,4-beta-xylanase [Polyangiaceae bacterium]